MLRSGNEHHGTTRIHIYTRSPRAPEGVLVQHAPAVAALAVAVILLAYTDSATPSPMIAPDPPQQYVDTTLTAPSGRTIPVLAGGDLRAALDRARPGDVITLEAGATFRGPFTLPNKPGSGWIYVQSSALASLPAPGTRVTPAQASLMPKIVGGSGSAIQTASGAHHYRFIGIEVRPQPGAFVVTLNEACTHLLRSHRHHVPCPHCDANATAELSLEAVKRAQEE